MTADLYDDLREFFILWDASAMRLCLLAYFDSGVTFGLGDDVFPRAPAALRRATDILNMGLRNPLGEGIVGALDEKLVQQWRLAAQRMVQAPEMELGYRRQPGLTDEQNTERFHDFQDELSQRLGQHPIRAAELTVYAVGTVLLWLELAPSLELAYARGVYKCFEFAAYERKLSEALQQAALHLAERAVTPGSEPLRRLAQRPPPEIQTDEKGREESRLLTACTWLALCIDPGDNVHAVEMALAAPVPGAAAAPGPVFPGSPVPGALPPGPTPPGMFPPGSPPPGAFSPGPASAGTFPAGPTLPGAVPPGLPFPAGPRPGIEARLLFEYHGWLHFDWSGCVLVPRTSHQDAEEARKEIERLLACIRIAHVFLGTCEAFERLFFTQTLRQAESFLQGGTADLSVKDLNRLRTLALAVVSLTRFASVTATAEDQAYFEHFERHAHIEARHAQIQNRCEILHNVQLAETQAAEAERAAIETQQQRRLGLIVLILTGLTFLSILADSYSFIRGEEKQLIPDMLSRGTVVAALASGIVLVLLAIYYLFQPRRQRSG